jgi:hypothetical protein
MNPPARHSPQLAAESFNTYLNDTSKKVNIERRNKMVADKLEVLNPVADMPSESVKPAIRPLSLDGKRVGLYWNYKPGGNYALERVGEAIKERFNGVSVKMYPSPRPVPKSILDAVKSECDVVVGSTGD